MSNPFNVIQPNKMPKKDAFSYDSEWLIEVTNNDGSVKMYPDELTETPRKNYIESVMFAKFQATPDCHMIIVKKDGRDFQRWDRERVLGGNDWHEVEDEDELKTIGRINQFRVTTLD